MGQAARDERDVRRQEERDGLLDGLGRQGRGGACGWAAAVQDEDVHPAEGADRRLHEALQVLRDRQVALDGERSDPLRLALQQ